MSDLNAQLFGTFQLKRAGQPLGPFSTKKARALCAYLLLHRGRPQPRAVLAGLFWGDQPEARARHSLADALWRLKRLLGVDWLTETDDAIDLDPHGEISVDVHEFFRLTRPLQLITSSASKLSPTLTDLRQAVALYQGELLNDFYDDWVLVERERCRELYLAALHTLADAAEAEGDLTSALHYADECVKAEPLNEAWRRRLMRLYALLGYTPLALDHYHALRHLLATELNVAPDVETARLYDSLSIEAGLNRHGPTDETAGPSLARVEALLPMVGRKPERSGLLTRIQAVLDGHGGATLMTGEAGVGKTRLIQSVADGAGWRGLRVMASACRRENDAAYGPLLRALSLPAYLATALAEALGPDQYQILARLASESAPSPVPGTGSTLSFESPGVINRVVANTFLALAKLTPLLLVIEDIHWSEAGTRQVLDNLLPLLAQSRLYVLLSGRAEALRAEAGVWEWVERLEREGLLPVLDLPPLSESETRQLASQAVGLGWLGPDVLTALYRASGGNPLFLLEIIRDWQERGADADWETYLAQLPRTPQVELVLDERLGRLGATARQLLALAAVFGLEIPAEALRYAASLADEVFLDTAASLLQARLLLETEAGFAFVHDLSRSTVLNRLTPERRKTLHCAAAQALAATQPQAIEAIAEHWEAGEAWDKAVESLQRAGQKAASASAFALANDYHERALAALTHLPGDTRRLQFDIREVQCRLLNNFDNRAHLAAAQQLLNLARQIEADEAYARAYDHLSRAYHFHGNYARRRETAEAALAAARRLGDRNLEAWALLNLGSGTEDFKEKRRLLAQALERFESLSESDGLYVTAYAFGALEMRVCRFAQARLHWNQARELAASMGWISRRWTCETYLTEVEFLLGSFEPGLKRLPGVYAQFERLGLASGMAQAAKVLSLLNLALGRPQAVLDWAERCCQSARASSYRLLETYGRLNAAAAKSLLGDMTSALADAQLAKTQAEAMGEINSTVTAHRWLAEFTRQAGDLVASSNHAETAARLAHESGLLLLEMRACTQAALTCLARGQPAEAVDWARRGLTVRHEFAEPSIVGSEDLYFAAYEAWQAAGQPESAFTALQSAWRETAVKAQAIHDPSLRQAYLTQSLCAAIVERVGVQDAPFAHRLVHLPRQVERGLSFTPDLVPVIWTIDSPGDAAQPGPAARRARLRRLLAEAAAQGTAPRQSDLAEALGVTERTIRSDLAGLD